MINKRNRWLVNIILILAVLAFVGFSVLPIFSTWLEEQQYSSATQTAGAPPPGGGTDPEDLQAQVRGYELVLEREPNNETALLGLLQAQLQLNNIEGAIAPLETLSELNPDDTRYGVLLGQAKQQIGDQEGAAQSYRGILSGNPGNMDALRGLVSLLVNEARPEAAIGLLQDTLKTANDVNQIQANTVDTTAVQLLLGELYVELERDGEALAIYDEAIGNSTDDFRPLLSKALLLQEQGQTEEAAALFANASELAPPQYKDEINRLSTQGTTPPADEGAAPATDGATDALPAEKSPEASPAADSGDANSGENETDTP